MAYSHTVTQAVDPGIAGLTRSKSYTGSLECNFSESIAVGTDTQITVTLDVSAIKSIYLVSDRQVTLETNATDASGGNTLVLKAGVPYVWNTDSYDTNKLTADVTKIYVTNASGGTALIEMRCIVDATP